MKADNILQTIGNTPHIRINRLFGAATQQVWIKSERSNPGGSIKDRIALSMVEAAEQRGALKPGGTIVEPTSGNTGVGLAMVAAVKGYKLILVMPDSMSVERRRLMLAYGASFELTPREKGMKGSIARAEEIVGRHARRLDAAAVRQPGQHRRPCAHHGRRRSWPTSRTGLDALITGVGTGGHITGCAQVLKAKWPQAQGVCGRAGGLAGDLRRRAVAAPDPGHRRRLHPDQPADRAARRRDPGRRRAGARDGAPLRARGRHAGRHLVGRHAGRDRAEAARAAAPARWCWASTTTPASVICRSRVSCRPEVFACAAPRLCDRAGVRLCLPTCRDRDGPPAMIRLTELKLPLDHAPAALPSAGAADAGRLPAQPIAAHPRLQAQRRRAQGRAAAGLRRRRGTGRRRRSKPRCCSGCAGHPHIGRTPDMAYRLPPAQAPAAPAACARWWSASGPAASSAR